MSDQSDLQAATALVIGEIERITEQVTRSVARVASACALAQSRDAAELTVIFLATATQLLRNIGSALELAQRTFAAADLGDRVSDA